jgi:23S rRNA (cytidine1920-2'-O)/16S rRNA (cytidine1409-2'-O)-methyltransferase
MGLALVAACPSPLPGPAGNIEFFVHLRAGATADPHAVIAAAVRDGEALAAADRS